MKTTLSLILMMTLASTAWSGPRSHVEAIETESMHVFYITSAKCQRGSEVHILYSNGDVVMSPMRIVRRKMVIDFRDVKSGTYTIVLTKGNQTEEFKYEKR